jgi:Kdo2-lipid IVA lauroyltransferase/acyltransferase
LAIEKSVGVASVGSRFLLGFLWVLHSLPLAMLAPLGQCFGLLLWLFAKHRRHVATRNIALCFPEQSAWQQQQLVREHFQWLGRSILERSLLWFASAERLKRLIHVEGDVHLAERSERPVMWLVPHFMGLDVAGVATLLYQNRTACSMYQQQSNLVFDAIIRKGRLRFGNAAIYPRTDKALPLIRAIRRGHGFFNLPDMDFGIANAAFVPFFQVPAATLLAPSRMARALGMVVQPVVAKMLPGGQGYCVTFGEPWTHFPTENPQADAQAMNQWIESEIRQSPAQYLWVHKRFKTRPAGETGFYAPQK